MTTSWLEERRLDVQDVWTKHPVIDWAVAALVAGLLVTCAYWHKIDLDPLLDAGPDNRAKAYSAFAIVVSILVAFTTATTTAYVSSDGARQRQLRQVFGPDVRRSLRRAITTGMLAVIVMIFGLILDTKGVKLYAWRFTLVPLMMLGLLRFARVAMLFVTLVTLKDADAADPVSPPVTVAPFDPSSL